MNGITRANTIIRRLSQRRYSCSKIIIRKNYNITKEHNNNIIWRKSHRFSTTITRGQDLLADSLSHGSKRKIILDSYYPEVGFEVIGMIEYKDDNNNIEKQAIIVNNKDEKEMTMKKDSNDGTLIPGINSNNNNNINIIMDEKPQNMLMNSSIIAFPNSCFLWNNITKPKDVTLESLSIVQILKPSIEYLFIGCDDPLPPRELNKIKKALKEKSNIVVEQMDVMNAMGTFNILNGEDRRVAVALVADVDHDSS